jgi:hypothetical protein
VEGSGATPAGKTDGLPRRIVGTTLAVIAAVALVLALIFGYVRVAGVDSDQFANRAASALEDESVRRLIGQKVTRQLVLRSEPDLLAAKPLIESTVAGVVGSSAFTSVFRRGVRDVHRALFDRDENTLTLTLTDVGTVVAGALRAVRPELADKLEAQKRVEVVRRDLSNVSRSLADLADAVRELEIISWVLTVLAAGGSIAVSRDRRRAVARLGIAAAIAGAAMVIVWHIGRTLAIDSVSGTDARAAAGAVWDAFLDDLRTLAWILAGAGVVTAAAAASLLRPIDINAPLRRAWDRLSTEPERKWARAARGVALLAAGLVALFARDTALNIIFTLAGLYLVYVGVSTLLWLIYRPREDAEATGLRASSVWKPLAAGGVAVGLIGGAVALFALHGGATTQAPTVATGCNGHQELCDRTLEEVLLAGTHNSMSVPDKGWYSAEQDASISDQLEDGVRALLIDTHYADKLPNGRLRTVIESESKLQNISQDISPSTIRAAERLRNRLGFSGKGKRGAYLCHGFCELGGTPLSKALSDIRKFLVANPGEVIVIINEDYIRPADFVSAVRKAGLEDMAYDGPFEAGKWPTLREMVERDKRIVFLAEHNAGAADWYQPAYDSITEETPFKFTKASRLTSRKNLSSTCRPNRGPKSGAPLFLVNHFVSTDPAPLPSLAKKVNARGPLLRRLRTCRRVRDKKPTIVAVNFYRQGDLMKVVDELNGVGDRKSSSRG